MSGTNHKNKKNHISNPNYSEPFRLFKMRMTFSFSKELKFRKFERKMKFLKINAMLLSKI